MSTPQTKQRSARQLIEAAAQEHARVKACAQQVKIHALLCGQFLVQARLTCSHGEFGPLLKELGFPETTSRRYQAFFSDAIASVIIDRKGLTDAQAKDFTPSDKDLTDPKLIKAAESIVIRSTLNFMELWRQLGLFRDFGKSNLVQESIAKARASRGADQLTFDFDLARVGVDLLTNIDKVPRHSLPSRDDLIKVQSQLQTSLEKVTQLLSTIEA